MRKKQSTGFQLAQLVLLLKIPCYLLGFLCSLLIPRHRNIWVCGSSLGFSDGVKAVALARLRQQRDAKTVWLAANRQELDAAIAAGLRAYPRNSIAGFWITLRAGIVLIARDVQDVNRYAVRGATIVRLGDGVSLTKSAVGLGRAKRDFLHRLGRATDFALCTASSVTAAAWLRTALGVLPGKVQVTGDPRHDELFAVLRDLQLLCAKRAEVFAQLRVADSGQPLVLFAPDSNPQTIENFAISASAAVALQQVLASQNTLLLVTKSAVREELEPLLQQDNVYVLDTLDTGYLPVFAAVSTDFAATAIDFAATGKPILWFVPAAQNAKLQYDLFEPLTITASGQVLHDWDAYCAALSDVLCGITLAEHQHAVNKLADRFHRFCDGNSADRALAAIAQLQLPLADLVQPETVFFESFLGKQVSCNPLALSKQLAKTHPQLRQIWSVNDENQWVPEYAEAALVGSRLWFAARGQAKLLIVNDCLGASFRRGKHQRVLQTWHEIPLDDSALHCSGLLHRARKNLRRQARRWSLLVSQNAFMSKRMREIFGYRGEIMEIGYPRCDELVNAVVTSRIDEQQVDSWLINPVVKRAARERLGITSRLTVAYLPALLSAQNTVDTLDVSSLLSGLPDDYTLLYRAHPYSASLPYHPQILDAVHAQFNDVLLAADVLVTDCSPAIFDAAVAWLPQIFFDTGGEDVENSLSELGVGGSSAKPGVVCASVAQIKQLLNEFAVYGKNAAWVRQYQPEYAAWRDKYVAQEDGYVSARVISQLVQRGVL